MIRGNELFIPTHSYKTITAPIAASNKTKNVNKSVIFLVKLTFGNFVDFTNKISVITSKTPLMLLCINSIISEVSNKLGIKLPLHFGQVEPHPSPEPVARTIAPAKIEITETNKPDLTKK